MIYIKKCNRCQRCSDLHNFPIEKRKVMNSPWPFSWWGINILGLFPQAVGQVKYLLVVVDYFIKCIKVETLVKIIKRMQKALYIDK